MSGYIGLFQSKTVWAGIIGVIFSLAGGSWIVSNPELKDQLVSLGVMLTTLISSAISIYGRVVAEKKVTTDKVLVAVTKEFEEKGKEEGALEKSQF